MLVDALQDLLVARPNEILVPLMSEVELSANVFVVRPEEEGAIDVDQNQNLMIKLDRFFQLLELRL